MAVPQLATPGLLYALLYGSGLLYALRRRASVAQTPCESGRATPTTGIYGHVNPSSPPAQLPPACANAARVFCALRFGSFYLRNLFLAVLYDEYTEGEAREKESKAAALDMGVLELEQSEALLQTEEQLLLAATDELEELGKLEAAPPDCGSGLLLGLVDHAYFSHLIMLLIVVNTGLMLCEHYGMSAALLHFLEQANVVLTACFTSEILLKTAAYGCHKYFDDPFSRFDAVVVFASLLELLLDYTSCCGASCGSGASGASCCCRPRRGCAGPRRPLRPGRSKGASAVAAR